MEGIQGLLETVRPLLPTVVAVAAVVAVLLGIRHLLGRRAGRVPGGQYRRQVMMLTVSLLGLFIIILVLPIGETLRGQLLGLIGIVLSAALALSSTTFIGNGMAGLMLRAVGNFRIGDFIRVGDHFGRVSERGLFHTEIQTEDRDLTTMPNLYLVTTPVTVLRASGTLLSAQVSLGYDIPRRRVETQLLTAAEKAGLSDAFVTVRDLGDFSVTYRVAGILPEVKEFVSANSRLRAMMLDSLHEAGIEVVSPTFMNTRTLPETRRFIPEAERTTPEPAAPASAPESVLFDKADQAESIEKLHEVRNELQEKSEAIKNQLKDAERPGRDALEKQQDHLRRQLERLDEIIQKREAVADE
jgi:small conductance mechanosensitive channel